MPLSLTKRAKIAWSVLTRNPPSGQKDFPLVWPAWRDNVPQWQVVDIQSYISQGFNLNTLIYSAVMYKVRALSASPLRAYIGDPDNPELLPPNHELSKLVARPNPHQSWIEFHSQNVVYENIAGNTFIFLDRTNPNILPRAMYSLRPDRMLIVPANERGLMGLRGYLYVPEGKGAWYSWDEAQRQQALDKGQALPILPQNMIHVKLPNPGDSLEGIGYGMSPISPAGQSADVDNSITKFLKLFFQKGVMVPGLLSFDMPLDPDIIARVREEWNEIYGGFENWTDVGILEAGAKYERIGLTFDEMGFDGLDNRNETRILGPFGVPPILIGSRVGLERSTYSNYEQARRACWEDTLVPENSLFETEYSYYLQSKDGGFVKFDYSKVPALQQDVPALVTAWGVLVDRGLSATEAAQVVGIRNMPNVVVAPKQPNIPTAAPAAPQPETDNQGAAEATTDDRTKSISTKENALTTEEKKALGKAIDDKATAWEPEFGKKAQSAFEFDRRNVLAILGEAKAKSLEQKATPDWDAVGKEVSDFMEQTSAENWQKTIRPLIEDVLIENAYKWKDIIGVSVTLDNPYFRNLFAEKWFDDYVLKFSDPISKTSSDELSGLLQQAEREGWSIDITRNRMGKMFDQWITGELTKEDFDWLGQRMPEYRRELIARTESMRAMNFSSYSLFDKWDVEQQEWLATNDDRTRPDHVKANGQIVAIGQPFNVGGYAMLYPGDPNAPVEEVANCRCTVLPVVKRK